LIADRIQNRIIPFYLEHLNRRNEKRRAELGKTATLRDESMMDKRQIENSKTVELESSEENGMRSLSEDNALHDMTDLCNEDFIYVY
jgi:hypothetical protein